MGTVKCTSFNGIKQHFKTLASGTEDRFIQTLPHDLAEIYRTLIPVKRLPIEITAMLNEAIAKFLFPTLASAQQLFQLGTLMAKLDMNGLYKILLKVATVSYAVQQSAVFWKTFHDQGVTRVEELGPKHLRYTISEYPGMPIHYQLFLSGWIHGLLELCGAKTIAISLAPPTGVDVVYDIHWS